MVNGLRWVQGLRFGVWVQGLGGSKVYHERAQRHRDQERRVRPVAHRDVFQGRSQIHGRS